MNTTFADEMRNNSKIHFDMGRKQFSFKNEFEDVKDLINKLYTKRMGVIENRELYDDIDKDDLDKLKNDNLLRVITIKEKKTKEPLILLYAKHAADIVENMHIEEQAPAKLKEMWNKIDQDEVERTMLSKRLHHTFQMREMEHRLRKTEKKKKRRDRDENNISDWRNKHIWSKIEDALKVLSKKTGDKKGFKKSGTANNKP